MSHELKPGNVDRLSRTDHHIVRSIVNTIKVVVTLVVGMMMRKFSKNIRHLNLPSSTFGKIRVLVALFLFGSVNGLTQSNHIVRSTATNMNASSPEALSPSQTSSPPCWLAIITEPDACDTDERLEESYQAIAKAVSERPDSVSLVSIRLTPSDSADVLDRATKLTKRLVQLSESCIEQGTERSGDETDKEKSTSSSFKVVCSSDWVEAAVLGGAHGVHVKEHHLSQIPFIRERLSATRESSSVWIGTSAHSVESALNSYRQYQPDYYFVGTCFLTASHPEKTSEADLEGPTLPGKVKRALLAEPTTTTPKVMAIGGIDASNCHIPVELGADGVAVIRAVLQAKDPARAVADMQHSMVAAVESRENTMENDVQDDA